MRVRFALLFLLFLTCEIGSHSFLDAHHEHHEISTEYTTSLAALDDHDHECTFAANCDDDSRENQEPSNVEHQRSHHDVLVSSHYVRFIQGNRLIQRFGFFDSHDSFRSLAPPYHPPKNS